MPRPWIEAAALLAAHDRPAPAPALDRPGSGARPRAALASGVDYALIGANPHAKPQVFADLDRLARFIQRARGLSGLLLTEVEDLECRGDTRPRRGVTVIATDDNGDLDRLIGHAWLKGQGRDVLQAALRRNRLVILDDAA